MFKNLKISLKMTLGFFLVIAILTGTVIFGMFNLNKVEKFLSQMYNSPFTVTKSSLEICNELNKISNDIRNALIDTNIFDYIDPINSSYDSIETNLDIIKPKFLGDPKLITDLENNLNSWNIAKNQFIDNMKSEDYITALQNIKENLNSEFVKTYASAIAIYNSAVEKSENFYNSSSLTVSKVSKASTIILIICIIIAVIIVTLTIKSIINPIYKLKNVTDKIATGNLDVEIISDSKDELGILTASFSKTVKRLKDYIKYIDEISNILNQIAIGNLNFELTYNYEGEFAKIKEAFINISDKLNDTISKINRISTQVSDGAKRVSDTAQSLAQGATDESSVVQELVATVNEVSERVDKNADNAQKANSISENTNIAVINGREQMNQVVKAMEDIHDNTNQIQVIVKTIEDIASQTNLLSLNAAIEAARAGEAGAGFSVVAAEIGKLADESGKATKNTTELIKRCILAAQNGSDKVTLASESLNQIVESVEQTKESISSIKTASKEQSESLNQIVSGIEQVSAIMQSNSAVSEESAATSEELAGQAEVLKDLVGKFILKVN